jgi:hypothetical protein
VKLVLCSIFLSLFVVECLIRAVTPLNLYEIVPDDPAMGSCFYRYEKGRLKANPGFRGRFMHPEFSGIPVEINDWGLRDGMDEATPPKPEEVSVLILGDSFAFGTGVSLEDTFHERLETRAAEIVNRPLRVFGAGIPGYSPFQELRLLNELAQSTRPNVVVLAFYEGNDFGPNLIARLRDAELIPKAKDKGNDEEEETLKQLRAYENLGLVQLLSAVTGTHYWVGSSATIQLILPRIEPLLVRLDLKKPFACSNYFLNKYLMRTPPP